MTVVHVRWVALVLVLVFAGLLGGLGLLVAMVLRKRGSVEAGGRCGKCGYSTRALTTFACPECGADLREVGIVQPTKPAAPMIAILIVAGVLGMFALLCCGGYWFDSRTAYRGAFPRTAPALSAPATVPATQPRSLPAEAPRALP